MNNNYLKKKWGMEKMSINLAEITPQMEQLPPRVIIYGIPGIGKSSFCASAPNVIFANIEKRLSHIKCSKKVITTYGDMRDLISALYHQEHQFTTLAIDSADWLERLVFDSVCKDNKKENIKSFGYGDGYEFVVKRWEELLLYLNVLREKKGMTILMTAHSHVKRFNDPANDPYDAYMLKMHDRSSAILTEWCDALLFATRKVNVQKKVDGFSKVNKADATDNRIIYTNGNPAFVAKNSYKLSDELDFPEENSYSVFLNAYNDFYNNQKNEVQ